MEKGSRRMLAVVDKCSGTGLAVGEFSQRWKKLIGVLHHF
jgi:hypothetical protein